ncbi:MAG TPA: choice-of-anchor tandem repeat GloVer-containing protein [Candidatus Sulfotelmatobacter sp.]|nr:choice-of-anchor tandem repeat GloVer-containing protein [Candidatus Sulfotelmatobacter sp.]
MQRRRRLIAYATPGLWLGYVTLLSACGGGGSSAPPTYSVGGAVSGLAGGASVVLQNNGGNSTTVSANGQFSFSMTAASGIAYAVTVLTQPTGQICAVTGGSGTVGGSNVTTVQVTCTNTYTISGTVAGLNAGAQVTLQNNTANPTTVTANGAFSFGAAIPDKTDYAVAVLTQPTGQTCTVTGGSGTVAGANVTGIQVNCATNSYTISGTVAGLNAGAQVTLLNNAADPTTVTVNGSFSFGIPILYNTGYAATVLTQPTGQTCTVIAGSGTVGAANVTSVQVTCAINTYTISGTVSGLNTGAQVTVRNNGTDSTTVKTNGPFSFTAPVLYNGSYAVTAAIHPPAQTCAVTAGAGSGVTSNISGVNVACSAAIESEIYSFDAKADGVGPRANIIQGSDGNFYGTTYAGGTSLSGTVFKITPAGVETVLHSFAGGATDGSFPSAGLIQGSDGNIYGTTTGGGPTGEGTVFKITPSGFETIFVFNGYDGIGPFGALVEGSDGSFYGTTSGGGPNFNGTVFKVTPNGVMTTLHSFTGGTTDGRNSNASLILGTDGNFYGTTPGGGANDKGTVFKITSAGVETLLYSFGGGTTDANYPGSALVQGSDGNFYGTTVGEDPSNHGAVYRLTPAGVETVLYTFAGGTDGNDPAAALIQGSDGNFYGTTYSGGINNLGTVFKITPAGIKTILHSFAVDSTDGNYTAASLIQGSDGNFYGTNYSGGASNSGTLFKITPTGTETVIYSFNSGPEGQTPMGLIQGSDGNFYGTTSSGGTSGNGTVFKISSGGDETSLRSFTGGTTDGRFPSLLTQGSDGVFYGTTALGGANNEGTVFKITPDGVETNLYSFTGGADGSQPQAALIQGTDGNFYGTTIGGGSSGQGTVFKITSSGFQSVLYSFTGGADGGVPQAALLQGADGNFYGTTSGGGATGRGTVFRITSTGVEAVLHSFAGGTTDGDGPYAALIQGVDGSFYGTTTGGGASSQGTVFKITPAGVETLLYSFAGGFVGVADGGDPTTALIQGSDGNFYGTAGGGIGNNGTLFKVTPTGVETVLYYFQGGQAVNRPGPLIQGVDGKFYGTTAYGGSSNLGTVFIF